MTSPGEECTGPVLIIFCTKSGRPVSLERAVTELARSKPNIRLERLATRHTGPMWRESTQTAEGIQDFVATS